MSGLDWKVLMRIQQRWLVPTASLIIVLWAQPGSTCTVVTHVGLGCEEARQLATELTNGIGDPAKAREQLQSLTLQRINDFGVDGLQYYSQCILRDGPLDLNAIEHLLMRVEDTARMAMVLDLNQLALEDNDNQKAIYGAAIQNGHETLWRGYSLTKEQASLFVSLHGVSKLHSVVLENCSVDSYNHHCQMYEHLQLFFGSSESHPERFESVADRLATFEAHNLAHLVETDPIFKIALTRSMEEVCPSRNRSSDTCHRMRMLVCDAWYKTESQDLKNLAERYLEPSCSSACPSQQWHPAVWEDFRQQEADRSNRSQDPQ